jgi:hypothetical protein
MAALAVGSRRLPQITPDFTIAQRVNLFALACDHVLGAARRVLRAIVFNRSLNVTVPARWPGSFWSLAPPTLLDPIERIGKKEFLFGVAAE